MFTEDKVPACRCTAHPAHEDKRKYMKVMREDGEHVVWCCTLCTEIAKVPTIQVRVMPRGKAMADYENRERNREKARILGTGKHPRVGRTSISEMMYGKK